MAIEKNDPRELLARIQAFTENPHALGDDDVLRRQLRDAGQNLGFALETQDETVHRIAFASMHPALAKVGGDTGIFSLLASKPAVSSSELARISNVDHVLMQRLLRYYQSVGMVTQLDADNFASNNVTRALAWAGGRSGVYMQSDLIAPAFLVLPQYLQDTSYQDPTDADSTPFHLATGQDLFQWMQGRHESMAQFGTWMSLNRDSSKSFLDVFDVEKELGQDADPTTILFVDIGGNQGHQCAAVRQRYPALPGRVVLQDLPHIVQQVTKDPLPGLENVEKIPHNMFSPQTLKGARAYYFRNVFHDWPDNKCKDILENLKVGMSKESVVLIDEIVVADVHAPWRTTLADMTMAACLCARERTESEWRRLAAEAGFEIRKFLQYRAEPDDRVMVLAIK